MKVSFNQTSQVNILNRNFQPTVSKQQSQSIEPSTLELAPAGLNIAQFHNVSFGAKVKPDVQFLLSQTKWLRCAYSGTVMIHPDEAKSIYQKLQKKPNAQSAINYLQQYQRIMHDVESAIFDIFKDTPRKGKRDFQDILREYRPEALERLKQKQAEILHSTDHIIEKLSPNIAEQVINARDIALNSIENGPFRRRTAVGMIETISASGNDAKRLHTIHKAWYQLPSSSTDIDAFIVQYSPKPHEIIAKRLISGAVATIEHVKPHSRGGMSELCNYLLVAAEFNSNRQSMPLADYINLNSRIDMRTNIQHYLDSVVEEVNDKRTAFSDRSFYPLEIAETIRKETKGFFTPTVAGLRLSKVQKRENEYPQRLGKLYKILEK